METYGIVAKRRLQDPEDPFGEPQWVKCPKCLRIKTLRICHGCRAVMCMNCLSEHQINCLRKE